MTTHPDSTRPTSALAHPRPLLLLGALLLAAPSLPAQFNGGYTNAGIAGEYFANADLSGSPAFTRKEVRLDFDWGTLLSVGGSIAEPYASFPRDTFSARYTGQLVPAHTQSHTFKLVADDGARLFIRQAGAPAWTTVIDAWSAPGTATGSIDLVANQTYDIRVEYRELSGEARLRLLWSSASVPEEVVDCLAHIGFNFEGIWNQGFTDIVKCARGDFEPLIGGNPKPAQDANGWPMADISYVLQESLNTGLAIDPLTEGRITFSFNGSGGVSVAGNVKPGSINYSYDSGTNTTSGSFIMEDRGSNATWFNISNTDRDGQDPARRNGVTNLKLMKPTAPGADTSYAPDTLFDPHFREAVSLYTHVRLSVRNPTVERVWADRTTPGFFNQNYGRSVKTFYAVYGISDRYYPSRTSYEHQVMICNEAGRDLYVNIPVMADGWTPGDNGYIDKLARLIKYGSDGVEPYTEPQANPVYPPLNPNLRVYFEISNEVWNWWFDPFRQHQDFAKMIEEDINAAIGGGSTDSHARPTDFAIYNYDNLPTTKDANGNYTSMWTWRMRKLILRVIQSSNIFRNYFGDSAMHTRVRPLFVWQYANFNSTASIPLSFADNYFNNADGIAHSATPHPISYYIWGGGGASYYGAANPYGVTDQVENSSFETPAIAAGTTQQAPAGSGWTFSGTAGIARDGGSGDDIPPMAPGLGSQCAYIDGTGSITITTTVPATQISNVYSVVFRAVQRTPVGSSTADSQRLRLSINGVPSNSRSFNQNGYTFLPTAYNSDYPWESNVVYWTHGTTYYSSNTFTAAPGSTVTILLEGLYAGQRCYIDDVRLGSIDRIFADGMPGGGEAAGQPAGLLYQEDLDVQSSWANGYGLNYMTYEGSWSLGGDTHGSPMQNTAKDKAPQAADAQFLALQMFARAGGVANTLAYHQWPHWDQALREEGLLDVDSYPLVQGHLRFVGQIPDLPTHAERVPCTIRWSDRILADGTSSVGQFDSRDWATFHLSVPEGGNYQIGFESTTGGNLQIRLDDRTIVYDGPSGTIAPVPAFLTRGIHALRLRTTGGSFLFNGMTVSSIGAPDAPEIATLTSGDLSIDLSWNAVAGATAYAVSYGAASGAYTTTVEVPASETSARLTGLTHDSPCFVVVQARNANGLSLRSAERSTLVLASGQSGRLAIWDLLAAGAIAGDDVTAPVSATVGGVSAQALTRGSGFAAEATWAAAAGGVFNNHSGAFDTLVAAKTGNHYVTWSVTPAPGATVSIAGVSAALYYQDNNAPSGALEASLDGFATAGIPIGTPQTAQGNWTGIVRSWDSSGIAALQNTTARVTFRLYLYGHSAWHDRGIGAILGNNADIEVRGSVAEGAGMIAPSFVDHPLGVSVFAGQDATFTVGLLGYPVPTVTWYRDGQLIPGASGTTYTLPNTQIPDNGVLITARAVNSVGSAESNPATLTILSGGSSTITFDGYPTNDNFGVLFTQTNTWSTGVSEYQFKSTDAPLNTANWRSGSTGLIKEVWHYEPIQMRRVDRGAFSLQSFRVSNGWSYPVSVTVKGFNASDVQLFSESFGPYNASTVCTLAAGSVEVYRVEFHCPSGDDWALFDDITVAVGGSGPVNPRIDTQPVSVTTTAGGSITLSVAATGEGPVTYQWRRNGVAIAGATSASLALPSTQAFHAGSYTCVVTSGTGTTSTTDAATVTVSAPAPSDARPMNLSTRALCLTGDDVLIPGFVVEGTGNKRLLMRAVGPELGPMGLLTFLPDPQMRLEQRQPDQTWLTLGQNDDWEGNANAADIAPQAALLGAFPLDPGSKSAALLMDVPAGIYTIVAGGKGADTGVAIVELYDADPSSATARLVNISNRGYVGTGNDIMIPGFVVSEQGPKTFLVRAVGPTLAQWLSGELSDPMLQIYGQPSAPGQEAPLLLTNDTWGENGDADTVRATAAALGAFPLYEGSADAAFVVTLPPGAYTVHARGVGGDTGIALVEVYLVP